VYSVLALLFCLLDVLPVVGIFPQLSSKTILSKAAVSVKFWIASTLKVNPYVNQSWIFFSLFYQIFIRSASPMGP
jgi:hypothetical protein